MKTSVKELDYDLVAALPPREHILPKKPNLFFRSLIRVLSGFGLLGTRFTYSMEGMDKIGKGEPCLILMNHSCFLDLMIASRVFYPRDYCIIRTSSSAFVQKCFHVMNYNHRYYILLRSVCQ